MPEKTCNGQGDPFRCDKCGGPTGPDGDCVRRRPADTTPPPPSSAETDATCDKMVALLEHYRRHCLANKWCRCKEINVVIAEYHAARKARTKNSKVHRNGPPVH